MQVQVLLFAEARQRVGGPVAAIDLPAGATVADLKRALAASYPALGPLGGFLFISIDSQYAEDSQIVPAHGEVAAIPPVSGGHP